MNTSSKRIKDFEKEFLHVFKQLCYSRSSWEVWSDLMSAMACSLSNSVDRTPEHFEQREKEYARCIKRLDSVEKSAEMLSIIVMALEDNPEQDFLGKIYMNLNLHNHWRGQFFTPYSICKMMSQINLKNIDRKIDEQGYISICDPACGAGATLIAAANAMKNSKYNFQNHVIFVGQDVDRVVAQMCYIQLSLLGCAGYICIGNTLTNPLAGPVLFPREKERQELWYMPMFHSDIWQYRKLFNLVSNMSGTVTTKKTVEKEHFYMFFYFDEKEVSKTMKTESQHCTSENDVITDDIVLINPETIKQMAKEKLKKEMKSNKNKTFAKPVIGHLLKRCEDDMGLAKDVVQKHKTWEKCLDYIYSQARKQTNEKCTYISDDVVYEWAEDYYHKDDKAEAENKAKKEAEIKAKQKKEVEDKKARSKEKAANKVPVLHNKEESPIKQPKPKRNEKDIDGQIDMFSIMGM